MYYYINQLGYPHIPYITRTEREDADYGKQTTVALSGCGMCAAVMVAQNIYKNCDFLLSDAIKISYASGANKGIGTNYKAFAPAFAERMNLNLKVTDNPDELIECIKSGGAAVIHCKSDSEKGFKATFTDGGHYVTAVNVESDGRIAVLDPSYKYGKYDIPERKGKVEVKDGYIALCDVKVLIDDSQYKKPDCFYLFTAKK